MATGISVRTMTRDEVVFAVELAAKEGWNPGLDDADSFHAADPEGFLLASMNGVPAGCASAVRYPGNFGFGGFFIVLPEYRGTGVGAALMKEGLSRLDGCLIGCDAVVKKIPKYENAGFRLAYTNIRFQFTAGSVKTRAIRNIRVIPVSKIPLHEILRYDRACFPADRELFLRNWLKMPHSRALAATSGGALSGYGVIRQCRDGWKIGPLFADGPDSAVRLIMGLYSAAEGSSRIFLDVPAINPQAIEITGRLGMIKVFETGRMYTGTPPSIDIEKVFGVTSFELG